MKKITRILFTLLSIQLIYGQTPEELKRFMDTYDKIKVDQEANELVKKGIDSEKDSEEKGPVRLLVEPGDVAKYYSEKMNVILKDLDQLNRLLSLTDSVPPLNHFGYNYFALRDSIQFIDNANISSNYILGYGDEVIISVWGQAEQYEKKALERDGTIFIENVGLLYLGGKTQIQAKDYLLNRFGKVYSSLNSKPQLTSLEFSIGKVKNINISVAGHVQYPGNYVVNPSISVPNILILAGGINKTGTLRNILLQRGDVVVDTLDLYPIITGVGLINQFPLFDGDIIVVPPRENTVAVTGDVLHPAYFEVGQNENVSTLLKYAGRSNDNVIKRALIARTKNSNLYLLQSDFSKTVLSDKDSLIIPIEYYPERFISVSITKRELMNIPWVKDLSFRQIIEIATVDPQNIRSVELIRRNLKNNSQELYPFELSESKNFQFFPADHLSIHLFDSFSPTKSVVVKGAVSSPGTYPIIQDQESLSSIIDRAGGLNNNTKMISVVVKRDTLTFGSRTGELILSPGDTVIAKPLLGTVKVDGEVHKPGNFEWTSNATAKDYLSFAGGLTSYGDKKHIIYITPYGEASRIAIRSNKTILPGGTILVSEKPISEQRTIDRFQQLSSLVSSLVSIAILASTTKN